MVSTPERLSMSDETNDAVARAAISEHLAICNLHLEAQKAANEQNKADHACINKSVNEMKREAANRWWWLMGVMLAGMGTIIMKLLLP